MDVGRSMPMCSIPQNIQLDTVRGFTAGTFASDACYYTHARACTHVINYFLEMLYKYLR